MIDIDISQQIIDLLENVEEIIEGELVDHSYTRVPKEGGRGGTRIFRLMAHISYSSC